MGAATLKGLRHSASLFLRYTPESVEQTGPLKAEDIRLAERT